MNPARKTWQEESKLTRRLLLPRVPVNPYALL
jgi:hypothetical protein